MVITPLRKLVWLVGALLVACAPMPARGGLPGASPWATPTAAPRPSPTVPPSPTAQPSPTPSPWPTMPWMRTPPPPAMLAHWQAYEQALVQAVLRPPPDEPGLCEWVVLDATPTALTVWAFCATDVRQERHMAVSVPALLHLDPQGRVVAVQMPEPGRHYGPSIRRIFPTQTHQRILRFYTWLDVPGLKAHLRCRFAHPGTPPLVVQQRIQPGPTP